eukprot:5969370-Karenia_brevis.AAC.1
MMEVGFTHPDCSTNPHRGVEILGDMLKCLLPSQCFTGGLPTLQQEPTVEVPTTAQAQNWEHA